MKILEPRGRLQQFLYFVRWQLFPVLIALPGHIAFILRGSSRSDAGSVRRSKLAVRMLAIHLRLTCAHSPLELLSIVEEIILLPRSSPGAVIECGTWLGGSTAKLSLACAIAGRRLLVCDSFEGLPEVSAANFLGNHESFTRGDFISHLEIVRANVQRFGELSVVDFVPGWYSKSLPNLPQDPVACAFLDVDLKESVEDCLAGLWSRLSPGAKMFVHDINRHAVVEPFLDRNWWLSRFGSQPPILVGARTGLGPLRRLLGYASKTQASIG